jgi:hypothetical protein
MNWAKCKTLTSRNIFLRLWTQQDQLPHLALLVFQRSKLSAAWAAFSFRNLRSSDPICGKIAFWLVLDLLNYKITHLQIALPDPCHQRVSAVRFWVSDHARNLCSSAPIYGKIAWFWSSIYSITKLPIYQIAHPLPPSSQIGVDFRGLIPRSSQIGAHFSDCISIGAGLRASLRDPVEHFLR